MHRRLARWVVPALLALVVSVTTSAPAHSADETPPGRLRVAVAASFEPVIQARKVSFEKRHNVRIDLLLGGAAALEQEAGNGAPVDVLVSASPDEMLALADAGRVDPDTRRELARNGLAVVTTPGGPYPRILHDLLRGDFELIAVSAPDASPLGHYTKTALEQLGLHDALARRLVYSEEPAQLIEYVASGQVPAAIVYRSDAARFANRVVRGPDIPFESSGRILYEGVVLAESGQPALALAFLNDLSSADARETVRSKGFIPSR